MCVSIHLIKFRPRNSGLQYVRVNFETTVPEEKVTKISPRHDTHASNIINYFFVEPQCELTFARLLTTALVAGYLFI